MPKSSNRLSHGFRSSTVLLPTDDPAEFEALLNELTAHFPVNDLTTERSVREMANAEWRLRRVRELMQSALARHIATQDPALDPLDRESKAIETLAETGCSYATWLRYESKFERQYERAYKEWVTYQKERRRASAKDADTLVKNALFGPLPADAASPQLIPANSRCNEEPVVPNVQPITAQQPAVESVQPPIARSAPCPCKSGEKYKRCCGRTAPGIRATNPRDPHPAPERTWPAPPVRSKAA